MSRERFRGSCTVPRRGYCKPGRRSCIAAQAAALLLSVSALIAVIGRAAGPRTGGAGMVLRAQDQETGQIYAEAEVKTGDRLTFEWVHSFEKIPWNEYYTVLQDGTFYLDTISVAGFGAGIPAEMDVEYRYEDGMICMDGIGSKFDRFRFFNSETALRAILLNDSDFVKGSEMPHHAKITVYTTGKTGGKTFE